MKTRAIESPRIVPALNLEYAATLTAEAVLEMPTSYGEMEGVIERMRGSYLERHQLHAGYNYGYEIVKLLASDGTEIDSCEPRGMTDERLWVGLARPVLEMGNSFSVFLDEIADLFGGIALIKVTDGEEPIVWTCYVGAGHLRPKDKKLARASHEDKTVCVARAYLLAAIERATT